MPISQEKMTFLTANYGLSPAQINAFHEAYQCAYYQMAPEIEHTWYEGGFVPEDEESAMIECIVDADRLDQYMDDYMDWCFDFLFKQELAHDIMEVPLPEHLVGYLKSQGKSAWMLR